MTTSHIFLTDGLDKDVWVEKASGNQLEMTGSSPSIRSPTRTQQISAGSASAHSCINRRLLRWDYSFILAIHHTASSWNITLGYSSKPFSQRHLQRLPRLRIHTPLALQPHAPPFHPHRKRTSQNMILPGGMTLPSWAVPTRPTREQAPELGKRLPNLFPPDFRDLTIPLHPASVRRI